MRPGGPAPALARLELTIVRRLEGMLRGEHLGLLPGPGTELAEARVYRPGEDDVRRMSWAVTARTTVPHVHDVVADRELETQVLVDLSASMDFGTAALEKRELAVAAVATVGFVTNRMGDRFGGYVVRGGRVRRWPPRSGRLALYALLRSLQRAAEEPPAARPDDLAAAVEQLSRLRSRRGLRVVVSDFLDGQPPSGGGVPPGGGAGAAAAGADAWSGPRWEPPMRRLVARHQVLAVELVDPRELELPDVGVVWLTDPESGAVREVDTADAALRARFAAAARAQRARTRAALRRSGVAHLVLRTDRDWVADTARFVLAHRRLAQRLHGAPVRSSAMRAPR